MESVSEIENNVIIRLDRESWLSRKLAHERKFDMLIGEYLVQRSNHQKNPVLDFLFEYYAFRPSALRRWSPGINVELEYENYEDLPEISELSTEDNFAWLDAASFPQKRIRSAQWILTLLENSQSKRPSFGCFGMHEWAMVYRTEKPRHNQVPLRMNPVDLAEFVESRPLVCTHFDAFRFFTEPAKPMNKFELSRENFHNSEQPGCIHSNMDLYKWAFKLYPWIGSDLIMEAFELALEARTIDMKASPYDLRKEDLEPIKIETEEGRIEYIQAQEAIYERGIPIRDKLILKYKQLLGI